MAGEPTGVPKLDGVEIAPWATAAVAVILWIGTLLFMAKRASKLSEEVNNLKVERDRIRAERDKLQAEAIEAAGRTLEKKQAAGKSHLLACAKVRTSAGDLIRLVIAKSPACVEARDVLCTAIADEVLHSFHDYCEWTKLEYRHRPSDLEQFILKVVCSELDRLAEWLAICNHAAFVKDRGLSPFKITAPTLHLFSQLCSELPPEYREQVATHVTRGVEKVLAA
jgi:hypothetical protein